MLGSASVTPFEIQMWELSAENMIRAIKALKILEGLRGNPQMVIVAPRGGGIEPGTLDIADAIAGSDYNFCAFKGIKKAGIRFPTLPATSLTNRWD